MLKTTFFFFYKPSNINEEVNSAEPSPGALSRGRLSTVDLLIPALIIGANPVESCTYIKAHLQWLNVW
jgi:hypothetical protein